MVRANRGRSLALLLLVVTGALLLAAGCSHQSQSPSAKITVSEAGDFVGNAPCAECHAAECKSHKGSRHDQTMHTATREGLGALAPASGVVPLAGYAMEERGGALTLVRHSLDSGKEETQTLPMALGSGKVGMTFIAPLSAETLLEAKMSYFPSYHLWDTTPGQEVKFTGDVPFGRIYASPTPRRCIGCHSTTAPKLTLQPEPRFFGVGCEACHGAGKAHIEAMHAKRFSEPHLENLAAWSPTRLNALCGKCHRNASDVDVHTLDALQTHRFQPYALQRSACRTKSSEPLSCLSCHDPHTDVSTDRKKYEQECLNCHAKPGAGHPAAADAMARQSKACPVNPSTGCIGCHMRPKLLFPKTTITATLADHLISIEKK